MSANTNTCWGQNRWIRWVFFDVSIYSAPKSICDVSKYSRQVHLSIPPAPGESRWAPCAAWAYALFLIAVKVSEVRPSDPSKEFYVLALTMWKLLHRILQISQNFAKIILHMKSRLCQIYKCLSWLGLVAWLLGAFVFCLFRPWHIRPLARHFTFSCALAEKVFWCVSHC